MPIYACTDSAEVARQVNLSWGVKPCLFEAWVDPKAWDQEALSWLKRKKLVSTGDELIFVGGEPLGKTGHVPWMEVRKV
jgi:pyruvate kinase